MAMTTKGWGTGRLTPSTVTCPSSMASSRADWVRLVARLSSSARKRLHITAPGWYSICPVALLYREKPVMSEGITSGVNCIRENSRCSALPKARAMVVFPTPGMSSRRIWPLARMAARTFIRMLSLPTMLFLTSPTTSAARFRSFMVPSFLPAAPGGPVRGLYHARRCAFDSRILPHAPVKINQTRLFSAAVPINRVPPPPVKRWGRVFAV